jgi:hypothetical protein
MHLILPDTRKYVKTKEKNILETTCFHLPINKLVTTIDTCESLNSEAPKYEIFSSHPHSKFFNKNLDTDSLTSQVVLLKQEQKMAEQIGKENE